jgi:hypothetical protein
MFGPCNGRWVLLALICTLLQGREIGNARTWVGARPSAAWWSLPTLSGVESIPCTAPGFVPVTFTANGKPRSGGAISIRGWNLSRARIRFPVRITPRGYTAAPPSSAGTSVATLLLGVARRLITQVIAPDRIQEPHRQHSEGALFDRTTLSVSEVAVDRCSKATHTTTHTGTDAREARIPSTAQAV